jgi:hypothetical protein
MWKVKIGVEFPFIENNPQLCFFTKIVFYLKYVLHIAHLYGWTGQAQVTNAWNYVNH